MNPKIFSLERLLFKSQWICDINRGTTFLKVIKEEYYSLYLIYSIPFQ